MDKATIIGLDIAKQVFQVHGINQAGAIVCRRRLRRDDVVAFFKVLPPCLIGIEACATGTIGRGFSWHLGTRLG